MSAITKERYDKLTPKQQGYASYMQGAWNKNIPNACPYEKGTKEYGQFAEGSQVAILEVQDYDDD
jgi:hypothetical protein